MPMHTTRFARGLLISLVLLSLLSGMVGPRLTPVLAAPPQQANLYDVIINEVAWAGTQADSADEWIELYNSTSSPMDITGWVLRSSDNSPNIVLSGTISANGYYLLERSDDGTIKDIAADKIYTGALNDSGESLELRDKGGNLIDTANQSGGSWPAGGGANKYTMERIDVIPDAANAWLGNDGITRNGLDASSNPINGTPKQINSATTNLLLTATFTASPTATATNPPPATATPTDTFTPTLSPTATLTFTPVTFTATKTPTRANTPVVPHVVISEVAWGGTKASGLDEWIELYNPTDSPVDLTNWQILADGVTIIALTGSIPARGFFLIERVNDNVVKNVAADQFLVFSQLSDIGAILTLLNDEREVVDTANKDGGAWPAGGNTGNRPSMERVKSGEMIVPDGPFAWVTNTGVGRYAIDAAGNDIYGTPGRANWAFSVTITPTATITPTRTITPTGTKATPTPTTTPTLGIIINEVAWMGTVASSSDEWIELYNRGSSPVDMDGWTLTLRSTVGGAIAETITITGAVPGNDYYIIAPSGTFTDVIIDQNASPDLNNNGDILELRDADGILIDTANADGGAWPAGIASPTYATMERATVGSLDFPHSWFTYAGTPASSDPHDRNNNLVKGTPGKANWAISVTATPTKTPIATTVPTRKGGSTVVATLSATVVINEFMPRAGFDWNQDGKVDVFDEFIEIANLGPVDISLGGWKLDDAAGQGSNPYTLPAKTLKPGERVVYYASQTNILLSDGGDTVRLLNPNNVIKDARSYSIVKVPDVSWCRLPDINGSWYADCFPTPNQRNSRTGEVPAAPPGTGLEEPLCLLPDTLPEPFRQAECNGFGVDMWQSMYWDVLGWFKDFLVPQNDSKWETFVE